MQKDYEIIYLSSKKIGDDKTRKIVNSIITKEGGKIIEESTLPKEKFAYPVKKQVGGSFLMANFIIEPQEIEKIDKKLKLQKEILRFMITAKKEIKERMVLPKKEKKKAFQKRDFKEKKVELEEIDKKIDEILKENIA